MYSGRARPPEEEKRSSPRPETTSTEENMKRRYAIIGSAAIAGISAGTAFAQSNERFGSVVIPPEKESGKEKHVPIITAPSSVKAGEPFTVTVEVGKTVPHPNTVEHHIKWIQLYAKENTSQYAVELGTYTFGPTFAQPKVTVPVMLKANSTIYALEHCNIHGLWDYSVDVRVS